MENIRTSNSYVDQSEPWSLYKNNNQQKLNNVLYTLINTIFKISLLLQPFLPVSSKKIFKLLKQKEEFYYSEIGINIKEGIELDKPNVIFPKVIRN